METFMNIRNNIRRTRISSFFSSKLSGSCTNLEHTSLVWEYAECTNLTVFGRRRCPRMKRISRRSRLTFRCHWRTNINSRVRGKKEKHSEKSQTIQIYDNILNGKDVCMNMHEHVTCNNNIIMGSAQSKPTSTQII